MSEDEIALGVPAAPFTRQDEPDEALTRQAHQDAEAFAELYRRYLPRVYRYHLARSGNAQDAQDLTSQTFLAALENLEGFSGRGTFASWLFGIARHKVADHYRRQKTQLPLEQAQEHSAPDMPLEQAAETNAQLRRVAAALQAIKPERAEALVLRLFGGLNAAEVGRLMGKSEASAKMLALRGLRDVRERFSLEIEVNDGSK